MSKGIRYKDGFKQDAVAQLDARGYAVRQVSEQVRISAKTLYSLGGTICACTELRSNSPDLSPIFRTMTTMRFPVNLTGWRSRYEEAVHRRTNH